ncbi:hypothetical protein GF348_24540 [candidate division KSB3 bacterium]|nr:hypothetical protein [candidate division KSB3 bacterium]
MLVVLVESLEQLIREAAASTEEDPVTMRVSVRFRGWDHYDADIDVQTVSREDGREAVLWFSHHYTVHSVSVFDEVMLKYDVPARKAMSVLRAYVLDELGKIKGELEAWGYVVRNGRYGVDYNILPNDGEYDGTEFTEWWAENKQRFEEFSQ